MAKKIRLLSTYEGKGPNTIVTVSDNVASYLLQGNIGATTDLTGGVYPADDQPTSIRVLATKPARSRQVNSSIMYLGDSISAQSINMAHAPRNLPTRILSPTMTNLNAGGLFVIQTFFTKNTPVGNGTLRFYAADKTMTWQAFGDSEGPRVAVSASALFYRLDSGAGDHEAYISILPRNMPTADKSDTVNVVGTPIIRNNAASNGIVGWTNTLLGPVFDVVYPFAIPGVQASEWWAARSQWQDIYTDVTHIFLGTNDVTTRATALRCLADIESMVNLRLAIGSAVVVGCLLPFDGRTTAGTRAVVEFNLGLRAMGERLGFKVWDAWPVVGLSTGTGGWAPGLAVDTLHPTSKGGYIIAKRAIVPLIKQLAKPTLPRAFAGALWDAVDAPYGNILVNPQLTGAVTISRTGITGEEPTGWGVYRGSGTSITAVSKAPASAGAVPLPDGVQGNYWSTQISNANAGATDGESINWRPTSLITTGYAVGTWVVFEGWCRVSGTGIQYIKISNNLQGGTNPQSVAVEQQQGTTAAAGDLDGDTVIIPFRSMPIQVEAATTSMSVSFAVGMNIGGTATFEISPQGLALHPVDAPA